jgi:TonB family protein
VTPVIDIAIRSSLVLLAGLAAARLLGRRSAAQRHLVLTGTIAGALAVAPLAWLGPVWSWSVPASVGSALPDPVVESPAVALGGASPARLSAVAQEWLLAAWLCGAAVAGARLLWRLARLRAISRRAAPLTAAWERVMPEIAATLQVSWPVSVRTAPDGFAIGSWGWRHPVILAPAEAVGWSDARVRLILLHELAHVRRADWLVQFSAEVLRALYWFNPLAAIVARGVRRESERACDDLVLRTGVSADVYGAELLDIARLPAPSGAPASLVTMAHPSTLEGRIAAMLDRTLDRRPVTMRLATALIAAVCAVVAPVATLRLLAQEESRGLTVQVFDPSGGVLPGVSVEIDGGQDAGRSAVSGRTGRVRFQDFADGDYTLRASLPGFRTLSAALSVRGARDRQRSITLQVAELQETISVRERRRGAAVPQAAPANEPVRVGGNIKVPRKLKHVAPEYPPAMLDAGLEGVVPMEALIGKEGSVVSVRVLSADVHPEFARAAEAAVRQWQFSPTLLNGDAVDVRMTVSIRFSLQD